MSGPESLSTHLRHHALTETLARARMLLALERRLMALIDDPELASRCRLANLRDTVLVLEADSPAWATRLRYAAAELRSRLAAAGFPTVTEIRVRVRPLQVIPEPSRGASLSAEGARHLRAAAATVTDEALAAALTRLASRSASRHR